MKIRILPDARFDLETGIDFYESQDPGLGLYFKDGLISDIESLRLYAGVHQKEHGLHRMLSKRFPFAIYYNAHSSVIEIFAVLDCRRDPRMIKKRLGLAQK